MNKQDPSPAVEAAKERKSRDGKEILTLSTGVRVKIKGVSASLIDDVTSRIPDPPIPKFFNENTQREEENPLDPSYAVALDRVQKERGSAAIDALILFGIELVDPMPDDSVWLPKLKLLAKLRGIDLSVYDLGSPLEKEFVYMRYVAVGSDDLALLGARASNTPEEDQKAEAGFPGNKEG